MAWLTGWSYRRAITIAPSADGAQADYQMKLLVGQSAGASGWQVHCTNLVLSTFDDLRFTTSDGQILCDYWIESVTGSSPNKLATVWIRIPSIPASPAPTIIYMYYGKSDAPYIGSGIDTFVAFSDFENAAAWHDDWTDVGDAAVTRDTSVKIERTASLKIVGATALDNTYRNFTGANYRRVCFKIRMAQTDKTFYPALMYGGSHVLQITFSNNGTITSSNSGGALMNYAANTWYSFEVLHDAANHKYSLYIDGVLKADNLNTYANRTYSLIRQIIRANTVPSTAWMDAWFAAKWTPNEPSWSDFGAQQVDPAIPSGTVAAAVASAMLEKSRLDGRGAELVIPPHCGLELWDVLAVLDTVANQDTLYRVAGYELEYDTVKGSFLHRLDLCDV